MHHPLFRRLLVVVRWLDRSTHTRKTKAMLATLSSLQTNFGEAADALFYTHNALLMTALPPFAVTAAADGRLWIITSNTFRGTPAAGDDRVIILPATPAQLRRSPAGRRT